MSERTDEQLLAAFRGGDLGAYRSLVERYHDDLVRFLIRFLGDRALADDVFQETFLQVYQSAGTFDPERRFRPWLFTIAANKGRDMLRKKGRRQEVDLHASVDGGQGEGRSASFVDLMEVRVESPQSGVLSEEQDRLVDRALSALSPPLREILLLAYFQRLSYQQVAEELGIPLGTVKSRLHAAVAAFAASWRRLTGESSSATGRGDGASGGQTRGGR